MKQSDSSRPRRTLLALVVLAALLPAAATAEDEPDFDELGANAFFSEPDKRTSARIDALIHSFSSAGVLSRTRAREELEEIGFWAVDPLLEALRDLEPPIKCASVLTLEAIGDPRAVVPLRSAIRDNDSRPFVPAFAALALGRYRDTGALEPFVRSLDSGRSALRSAIPLALAKIHTDEARDELLRQLRRSRGRLNARMAQYLSLGFFPEAALDTERRLPGKRLAAGLDAKRSEERAAALAGYLVATLPRGDTREFLLDYLRRQSDVAVELVGLVGISRYEDPEVSRLLSRIAAGKRQDDQVRALAADLLVGRGDPVTVHDLLAITRAKGARRLRATAALALASFDDEQAVKAVLSRLDDTSPLVRTAAAIACTQLRVKEQRAKALKIIDSKLRSASENSGPARRVFRVARSVLRGERKAPQWESVVDHEVFRNLDRDHVVRLLAVVNRVVEHSLDLAKIHNLQGDTELESDGAQSEKGVAPESGDQDIDDSGDDSGGDDDTIEGNDPVDQQGEPSRPPDPSAEPRGPPGRLATSGRTSNWQELRDLKVRLRERPYFTLEDLPGDGTSTGK
jgi:HEAT repeat protein